MHYDVSQMPREISGTIWPTVIGPRPVYLIVTRSIDGVPNIAPFSSISCISNFPPIVSISFGLREGNLKVTAQNIYDTGTFTVNTVDRRLAELANKSAEGESRQDDFERFGLTKRPMDTDRYLGIKESCTTVACDFVQSVKINESNCTLIFGMCKQLTINDDYIKGGLFDITNAETVASVGVEQYITIKGDAFTLPRLWK